jgi:hypothetical protein
MISPDVFVISYASSFIFFMTSLSFLAPSLPTKRSFPIGDEDYSPGLLVLL